MGLRREDVYIANIIKCRPPGNRTPEREECGTCSPFLMRQIAAIQPKAIVALGAVAAKTLLAINAPMSDFADAGSIFVAPSWLSLIIPRFYCAIRGRKKKAGKTCKW